MKNEGRKPSRNYQPTWRIVERIIFWTLVAGVGVLLSWS